MPFHVYSTHYPIHLAYYGLHCGKYHQCVVLSNGYQTAIEATTEANNNNNKNTRTRARTTKIKLMHLHNRSHIKASLHLILTLLLLACLLAFHFIYLLSSNACHSFSPHTIFISISSDMVWIRFRIAYV